MISPPKVDWQFTLAMAAYDLVRLPKLFAEPVAWSGLAHTSQSRLSLALAASCSGLQPLPLF
jgi:hypothetical protein